MTAEELWKKAGLSGSYEAWSFGGDPDRLAALVTTGIKTATSSAYDLYAIDDEPLPRVGDYSVILNSAEEAVCIIRTTAVYIVPFDRVSARHAFLEGEGDRSLAYWQGVHRAFFTGEMSAAGLLFSEQMQVVCEEFAVVLRAENA
ncbi:MAG: ASCH domain-containing protein [Clostridia bacterium]|nr:ASCH domain-containing protein [Clostridia bacterium]